MWRYAKRCTSEAPGPSRPGPGREDPRYNGAMRRFGWWLLFLLGLVFLVRYREALWQALVVLTEGRWTWIGLAFLFQAGWLFHTTLLLWLLYRRLGIPEVPWRLAIIVVSSLFLNLAVPTAGISGVAIFAADAHRRGHSASKGLVAGTLHIFFEHLGFLAIMFLGLWVLVRRNRLTWVETTAAGAMVLLVVLLFILVALALWVPDWLERGLLRGLRRLRRWLPPQAASSLRALEAFLHDLTEGLTSLERHPRHLFPLLLLATTNKLWHLLVMASAFYAFDLPLSPGTLLGAYVVVHLFFVVAPVPGGIGFAEGALIVLLHSFGFPLHDAMVVTLTYRAVTFWIPFLLGMPGLRYLVHSSTNRKGSLPMNPEGPQVTETSTQEVTHAATTGTLRAE